MKLSHFSFITLILMLLSSVDLSAQDFVYTPINSNFGGNSYNYNWLITSANQQNKIEEETVTSMGKDPLEDFADNLNRQILNQLSSQLVNDMFGETGDLETGTYDMGSYRVDIYEDNSGVNVNILDKGNGNHTNVFIPSY